MVTTPPISNLTVTAIDYIKASIAAEIDLIGVFFYQDGVMNANKLVTVASDEYQTIEQWKKIHCDHGINLHLCYTAAEKRGMSDDNKANSINENFIVSGLGELVELSSLADRVVQF